MTLTDPDRRPGDPLDRPADAIAAPRGHNGAGKGGGRATEPGNARKPAFYELDRYARFRDPVAVAGIGLLAHGVSRWSPAGAEALVGLAVVFVAWLMSR